MNTVFWFTALVFIGATLGSFAGASVWRLRARQLKDDKKHGEKVDTKEYNRLKKLTETSLVHDRSRCLHCDYTLRWYDLIPIVSWLTLRGKCRECKKPIGKFELLMELGVAAFFVLSFVFWPLPLTSGLDITYFVLWLVAGVIMAILFAYDAKWFLLPDSISVALMAVGLAITTVSAIQTEDYAATALSALGAIGALAGLYAVLHYASKGKWVGLGDVKLGIGLGLLLVDWQLAFIALFLANLVGTFIVVPLLASKKLSRTSHVPFGPMLIAGTVLAWFIGWPILNWYLGILGV